LESLNKNWFPFDFDLLQFILLNLARCDFIYFIDFKLFNASAVNNTAELRIGTDGFFAFTRTADDCSEVLTATNGGSGVRCDWTGATAELTPNMA